jgi:RNA-binding protein
MLTGKQKRFLRRQAHQLKPIFQVGKDGVNEEMLKQMDEALERRELIKVSILQNNPDNKNEVANEVASGIDAELVQVIGNNFILYKESEEHKQIELP